MDRNKGNFQKPEQNSENNIRLFIDIPLWQVRNMNRYFYPPLAGFPNESDESITKDGLSDSLMSSALCLAL